MDSLSKGAVDSSNRVAEMADTQALPTLMNTHEVTATLMMMEVESDLYEDMVAQLIMPLYKHLSLESMSR